MHLSMAGIDVHTADISMRESFAFSLEQEKTLLTAWMQEKKVHGAVLLATCNRTELYITSESAVSPAELLLHAAKIEQSTP